MERAARLLAVMGLAMAINLSNSGVRNSREFDPGNSNLFNHKKIIPKGCKEYTIKGVTVIALNEKSALKKINKILAKQKS